MGDDQISQQRTCKTCLIVRPLLEFAETGYGGYRRHHCRVCYGRSKKPSARPEEPLFVSSEQIRCFKCGEDQHKSNFPINKKSKKPKAFCFICDLSYKRDQQEERRRQPEARKLRNKQEVNYYQKLDHVERGLRSIKARALRSNVPFELTVDQYKILRDIKFCDCCGCSLIWGSTSRQGGSVDRLIPALGYVLSNLAVICRKCNVIKNDATAEEIRNVANWLQRKLQT